MKQFLRSCLLVASTIVTAVAQHQIQVDDQPKFANATDSATYVALNEKLRAAFSGNRTEQGEVDSLFTLLRVLREKSVGTIRIFARTPSFTTLDQLRASSSPGEIKHLALEGKHLKKVPPELFRCTNLEALELVNTRIKRMPRQLKQLIKLQSLWIVNNTPRGATKLGTSYSVKTLGLRGNDPRHLPTSYRRYPQLEKLDASACRLTSFPKGIDKAVRLKELMLANNEITLSRGTVVGHLTLEKLELQRNKIERVPADIAQFPKLKRLTLNYNNIRDVDPAIARLQNLEQLAFYQNKLTAIPERLFALRALKEVDFYYNQIERLDDRVANWSNLEVLYLSNNRLVNVPESIGSLTKLNGLYLHNNRISILPESIGKLQQLSEFRVNNNNLTQLPASLLTLASLENLDVSNNRLSQLPPALFDFPRMKIMVLFQNPWDVETREQLPAWAEKLRARDAVVHTGF